MKEADGRLTWLETEIDLEGVTLRGTDPEFVACEAGLFVGLDDLVQLGAGHRHSHPTAAVQDVGFGRPTASVELYADQAWLMAQYARKQAGFLLEVWHDALSVLLPKSVPEHADPVNTILMTCTKSSHVTHE
ncbi:hypothetical protein Salmuc_01667 [Salipiger mucosus DSM 16094]|uniref:Uncharacterized protein n=1 Tax=Salipiger mucosus DSM 16094 TaxID=1123237 RepID=S9QWB5_9RHOB|nr:hypothetical protein Salmuc_01667 [Salipiger mucosus DSM 16094]